MKIPLFPVRLHRPSPRVFPLVCFFCRAENLSHAKPSFMRIIADIGRRFTSWRTSARLADPDFIAFARSPRQIRYYGSEPFYLTTFRTDGLTVPSTMSSPMEGVEEGGRANIIDGTAIAK